MSRVQECPNGRCLGRSGWTTNKGDENEPEYLSKFVAKEIKREHNEDNSSLPQPHPLEASKLLFSLATTGTKGMTEPLKLLLIGMRRAYVQAKSERPAFVQVPAEDVSEGQCGRLEVSMYGSRNAAADWEAEHTNAIAED